MKLLVVINNTFGTDALPWDGYAPFVMSVSRQHDVGIWREYGDTICLNCASSYRPTAAGSMVVIKDNALLDNPAEHKPKNNPATITACFDL